MKISRADDREGPASPRTTSQFKRDYKRCKKRDYPVSELKSIMELLISGEVLDERHRDHELSGEWRGHRDCHVRGDWLLIYRIEGNPITFERTGTHADLFE